MDRRELQGLGQCHGIEGSEQLGMIYTSPVVLPSLSAGSCCAVEFEVGLEQFAPECSWCVLCPGWTGRDREELFARAQGLCCPHGAMQG